MRQDLLIAATAPSHWQQELSEEVAQLGMLHSACDWLKAIVALPAGSINNEPLFGSSLTTLVSALTRLDEPKAQAPRSRRSKIVPAIERERNKPARSIPTAEAGWLAGPTGWRRRARSSPARTLTADLAAPASRSATIDPLTLPPHAEHELLQHLNQRSMHSAGDERAQPGNPAATVEPSSANSASRLLSAIASPATSQTKSIGQSIAHLPTADARRNWQIELARRAGRRLDRWLATTTSTSGVESSLLTQWSTPIDGPTASRELLIELLRLRDSHLPANDGRPTAGQSPHDAAGQSPYDAATESLVASQHTRITSRPIESEFVSVVSVEPATAEGNDPIQPPLASTMLPPLLPPQVAHAPAPRVASPIARQGAWFEAATLEDDLDVLAEKIKRILDEEARRQGIDV